MEKPGAVSLHVEGDLIVRGLFNVKLEIIRGKTSLRNRKCASGCEEAELSGEAEDSPVGGRGRDDLRAAGGWSDRLRHTKAVCVHC